VVKLLLEKGAELEAKDEHYGGTRLCCAAAKGHEAVVICHNDQVEKSSHLGIFFLPFDLREQRPRSDSSIAAFRVFSNSPF
jgi:hypothetical protein